jgi:DNA-binding beta-propeller fold protein YncE
MLEAGSVVVGNADRYTLVAEHGRGGFGVTWKATRSTGEQVILKLLHTDRLQELKALELFDREAKVLAALAHPAIPRYVDSFTIVADGKPSAMALVQSFVPGENLAVRMRRGERLGEAEMIAWLAQILEVLGYLHQLSPPVIHRDVTPKNIILSPEGKAYLVDFGTVQAAVAAASEISSTAAGTFGYAPMEQFVARAYPSSDLYGLGMTYLAVATGKEPEELPLDGVRVDVRRALAADARIILLLDAMTEPDPRHRLGDARLALERIRPLRGRAAPPALVEAVARQTRDPAAPAIATDDLLPSERLQEAAARLADIPATAAWLPPRGVINAGYVRYAAFSSDGAVAAVVVYDAVYLLGPDLAMKRVATGEHVAVTPDGRRLAALSDKGKVQVVELAGGTARPVTSFTVAGYENYDDGIAIAPDGQTVAVATAGRVLVCDATSGTCGQTLACKVEEYGGFSFSPDGGWLFACDDDERLHGWGRDGETASVPGTAFAFSPDGRTMALAMKGQIILGSGADILRGRNVTRTIMADGEIRALAFSPDARLLAFGGYDTVPHLFRLEEYKPSPLALATRTRDPDGNLVSPRVHGLGFASDGRRLLAVATLPADRFSCHVDALFAWAVDDRRPLGAITGERTRLRTPLGFHDDPPDRDEKGARSDPWLRADVARRLFLGERLAEILDATDRARLGDFETRWAFCESLRRRKLIPADDPLAPLLDATAGLTHLLPAILDAARTAQGRAPRFGAAPAASGPLTTDLIVVAAKQIAAKPESERQAIFEQLLADARAAERAALAAAEAAQAPPPPRAPAAEDLAAAHAAFTAGLAAELREDKKWLRHKDYREALRLLETAAAAGHPESEAAAARVRAKLRG